MRNYLLFLAVIILGLGLFVCILFNGQEETVIAQKMDGNSSTVNSFSENDKTNALDKDEIDIKRVIEEYCLLAKQGKVFQLKRTVVKVQTEEYFAFDKTSKKLESKSDKDVGEVPVLSGVANIFYELVTQDVPEIIYVGQRHFYKALIIQKKENKVKVLIQLESNTSQTRFIEQSFYLIKNSKGEWRIYRIDQVIKRQESSKDTFL
jgi:hypothetical protein